MALILGDDGGRKSDRLRGGIFDDQIYGGFLGDTLYGGGGDVLLGATGNDKPSYADMTGDPDLFLFLAGAQDAGGGGIDTISGFAPRRRQ